MVCVCSLGLMLILIKFEKEKVIGSILFMAEWGPWSWGCLGRKEKGAGGGGASCEFRFEPGIYVVSDPNKY